MPSRFSVFTGLSQETLNKCPFQLMLPAQSLLLNRLSGTGFS